MDSKETSDFLIYKYTSLFFLSLFPFFPFFSLLHVFKDFYWTGLGTLDAHRQTNDT